MKNTTDIEQDRQYMKMALELAQKGMGFTAPNPMVGAVIVKNGRIIGQGYHRKYGGLHAEREALAACTEEPKGASIYVTLEPCCHYGKQPPCVNAILEAGIRRVIIGSSDPNPLVAGKGIRILKDHGIEVTENILKEECDKLNEAFFYYIQNKKPYVVMKYAMTMDGKIAAYTGESKWVTGEAARIHVQEQRLKYTGIMVGVGTVLADDPMLTCRLENSRNPVRIICDSHLRTPLTSKIVRTAKTIPTILASSSKDQQKIKNYEEMGCQVLYVPEKNGHIDLNRLMEILGATKIDSILLEGGGSLNWSALESGIVQKVQTYIAPKLFGGEEAKTPVEGKGFPDPASAVLLKNSEMIRLGDDFLIESEVKRNVYGNC
nr:bifunctional diaminohydroxyphosphoribosylaminopyrimidine deaminase/5-amino-6-(5-phosphoribosylamino)uracil reductase RibD [Blautia luti]